MFDGLKQIIQTMYGKLIKLKYVKRLIEICIWILELNKCLVYENKLINKHTLVISIKNYYYAFLYY